MVAGDHTKSEQSSSRPTGVIVSDSVPYRADRTPCDLLLVRQLLERNESAWQEFVSQYRKLLLQRIYATASELSWTGLQPDMVEEIIATVMVQLVSRDMESLRQFSGGSRLSTWLSVIVRRVTLRHLTGIAKSPRQSDTGEMELVSAKVSEDSSDLSVRQETVESGMRQLADADCQITTNAVGPKINRARRRLQKLIEECQP
jgi:RNA polymerase sigma-70 factor (ECF subfamily)